VIGEDETLLREGLELLLARAGFDVVASAGDAQRLIGAALEHDPDVVVTDIRMPPTGRDDGLRAGLSLRRRLPGIGLVVLSQHLSPTYAVELLSSGAGGVGYLWKQRISEGRQFAADVRTVGEGGTVLDADLTEAALRRATDVDERLPRLTRRQREVLALMARGFSTAAIAATLFITEKSVVEHVSHVYDVLGLPNTGDEHRRVLAVLSLLSGAAARLDGS
jgi:DNA-binding NarL/FixJ family response regulator